MSFIRYCKRCGNWDIKPIYFENERELLNETETNLMNKWWELAKELDKIDLLLNQEKTHKDCEKLQDRREDILREQEEIDEIFYKNKEFNKWMFIGKIIKRSLILGIISFLLGSIFYIFHYLKL